MRNERKVSITTEVFVLAFFVLLFMSPFYFMFINSVKDQKSANLMTLTIPQVFHFENYLEVIKANHFQLLRSFVNSGILTLFSVLLLISLCSAAGFVIQRRQDKLMKIINTIFTVGLILPAAILPTIWVLKTIHLYKTIVGMILIECALQIPFTVMLYRGYMSSIPEELEDAACIDGCSRLQIFLYVIFPLLKPVSATVIILNAVSVFNDFTNPLYFLPGKENVTVQLTLYSFMGRYSSSYNLLFADAFLITIPMFVLFVVFNKKIISGMATGAIKG